jgi:CO/xanthine dehydrogenase Mo-binding subunit
VFARESFVDELAHATGRDPLQLRLELLSKAPNPPAHRNAAQTADRLIQVLRAVTERAGWAARSVKIENDRRRALGLACNAYHGDGAMVAQVADVSVGGNSDIRVHRITTAIDVGRVIDRSGLEAQVQGGVAWALTAALQAEVPIVNGRAAATSFAQYPIVRMRDMPEQDVIIVESGPRPYGAGEPPVPAVYAAVANAVFAATGERVRQTPIRLSAPESRGR